MDKSLAATNALFPATKQPWQKCRRKGCYLHWRVENVPWRFHPRSRQQIKAIESGTFGEGPVLKLPALKPAQHLEKGQTGTIRVFDCAPYPKHLWVEVSHKDFPAFSRPAGTGQVWPFFALQIDGGDSRAPLKTTKWQRVKKGEEFPQSEAEKDYTLAPREFPITKGYGLKQGYNSSARLRGSGL